MNVTLKQNAVGCSKLKGLHQTQKVIRFAPKNEKVCEVRFNDLFAQRKNEENYDMHAVFFNIILYS